MIIFQDIDELATLRQENEQLKQSLEKEQKLGTDLRTEISRLQKVLFDFNIWALSSVWVLQSFKPKISTGKGWN